MRSHSVERPTRKGDELLHIDGQPSLSFDIQELSMPATGEELVWEASVDHDYHRLRP